MRPRATPWYRKVTTALGCSGSRCTRKNNRSKSRLIELVHNLVSLNQLPKLDDIIELTEQEKKQLGLLGIKENDETNLNPDISKDEECNNENIH